MTAHDLPEIGKRAPELALLRLPAIDTLVLSPIAFPQRPYHRLVKPYKTPGLERLQVNDPLIDAGTTALLLGDICKTLQSADPTRLAAWHWLLTREAASDGYERLFARIRAAPQPEDDEGMAATLKAMDELGWLREWRRDLRREQRGLLLTSAHRAKGLEFDHVVILDGRWRRHQGGEDDEATQRLYYVAMTRARLTVTLMRGREPEMTARALQAPLEELESIVLRKPGEPEGLADAKGAVIKRYGLRDVNRGYSGLFLEEHQIHRSIANARTGDPLTLVENNARWDIRDAQGRMVGRMAKRFEPPDDNTLAAATVDGIFRWGTGGQAGQSEKWQPKVDTWEVVIPEVTWRRT